MDQSQPVESTVVGRPRFWVGPLVAGCCFAMGFGITDRVVSLQSDIKPAQSQRFAPSYFPGDSLQTLRSIHQGDASLQVDLAARKLASPGARRGPPRRPLTLLQRQTWLYSSLHRQTRPGRHQPGLTPMLMLRHLRCRQN
jgi:hypothetical protein